MADCKSSETTIVNERQELMIDATSSLANQTPTPRIAHFLKPSLNLITSSSSLPPFPQIPSFSLSSKPINVVFTANSTPAKNWQTWVDKLQETHEPAWRKAGIFDAIKGSTYNIIKNKELIFTLVKQWCPKTNTFILPWGEITVTLEDVMILGGFSPSGESVLCNSSSVGFNNNNVDHVKKKLIKCYQNLLQIDHNVTHYKWMEYFIGLGGEIENAGCLSLWLARHVFQLRSYTVVSRKVLPIAARLSCGVKIALGPAVLASLYRDLTLLKERIMSSSDAVSYLWLSSPLQLVQVWAWERFPSLGPVPRMIRFGETRLARWSDLCCKGGAYYDIEMCLDSARDTFRWRPYAVSLENWLLPGFYVDSGTWVGEDCDEELLSFAHCLMVCKLVGLKSCVECYNPHRVALQFGFDQDIPNAVVRYKANSRLEYDRKNLAGLGLYLPPRLYEGDVTYRYSNWWRTGFNYLYGDALIMGCKKRKRSLRNTKKLCKRHQSITACISQGSNYSGREPEIRMFPCILAEADKYEVADHDEEIARLSEMFLGKKQGNGVMGYLCSSASVNELTRSEYSPGHQYLANEAVDISMTRQEGDTGKYQHKEDSIVELVHQPRNAPAIETLCLLVAKDEPVTPLYQDADINHVNNRVNDGGTISVDEENADHNSFVALCDQFELRISRLERDISCLKAAKFDHTVV